MSAQTMATLKMIQLLQEQINTLKDDKTIDIRFDDKDPALIYGGTWTKIEGKFLFASGGGAY